MYQVPSSSDVAGRRALRRLQEVRGDVCLPCLLHCPAWVPVSLPSLEQSAWPIPNRCFHAAHLLTAASPSSAWPPQVGVNVIAPAEVLAADPLPDAVAVMQLAVAASAHRSGGVKVREQAGLGAGRN